MNEKQEAMEKTLEKAVDEKRNEVMNMEPEGVERGIGDKTPQAVTLFGAIKELNALSWELNGMVFGETPEKQSEGKGEKQVEDKITQARNLIMDSNRRMRTCIKKLKGIGA